METIHRVLPGDATRRIAERDDPIHLVVTSPPYPMIEMWDHTFREQAPEAGAALDGGDGPAAWEAMHALLDRVWCVLAERVVPGGILCVNIGDATRRLGGRFRLYANHVRVAESLTRLGLEPLPGIIWRKSTNSPTKFLGSGMLAPGAYVTLEHEHILLFRRPGSRSFEGELRQRRRRSAYFWEERNSWFSDLWQIPGARQRVNGNLSAAMRDRSGAFPLEVAYRLVNMFSIQGDLVADPFAGTGTTALAAMRSARASLSCERDVELARSIALRLTGEEGSTRSEDRLNAHRAFLAERATQPERSAPRHRNRVYDFPVMTAHEQDLVLPGTGTTHLERSTPGELIVRAHHEQPIGARNG